MLAPEKAVARPRQSINVWKFLTPIDTSHSFFLEIQKDSIEDPFCLTDDDCIGMTKRFFRHDCGMHASHQDGYFSATKLVCQLISMTGVERKGG
jgi:hypothetical protein